MLLKDKVALITGGAGRNGLGYATARMMAAQGARVVILDLARAEPAAAAADLGEGHLGIVADGDRQGVVRGCRCRRAGADGAASTSSSTTPASPSRSRRWRSPAPTTTASSTSACAARSTCRRRSSRPCAPGSPAQSAACPRCQRNAAAASWRAPLLGGQGRRAGSARAMAREFGIDGIRVNCVTPGLIATDINKGLIPDDKMKTILEGIPLNRIGEPTTWPAAWYSSPATCPST